MAPLLVSAHSVGHKGANMLQPLGQKTQPHEPVIMRTCEACNKQVESSTAINCIIVVGSPGHHELPPFQCEHEEHWACSLACWRLVAHACIDEHMHEMLQQRHKEKGLL